MTKADTENCPSCGNVGEIQDGEFWYECETDDCDTVRFGGGE